MTFQLRCEQQKHAQEMFNTDLTLNHVTLTNISIVKIARNMYMQISMTFFNCNRAKFRLNLIR